MSKQPISDSSKTLNGFEVKKARNGKPTLLARDFTDRLFYIHSPSDPVREAQHFVARQKLKPNQEVVLVGLGLGYHLEEILKTVGSGGQVKVFEANPVIFKLFKELSGKRFLNNSQVKIIINNNPADFLKELSSALASIHQNNGKLIVHTPSLRIWSEEMESLKQLLLEWKVQFDLGDEQVKLLQANFVENYYYAVNDYPVSILFDILDDIPLVLVSAGPSLDRNIGYLKKISDRAVIMAVGTALKPLQRFGIMPHLVVITDPQALVAKQVENIDRNFPLIYLPTVCPYVVFSHPHLRFVAFQEGWEPSEQLAQARKLPLIKTGGSVATTALDIAIKTNANPIILVGQDLAYSGNRTHAQGTMHEKYSTVQSKGLIYVEGNYEKQVPTSTSWMIYLKWMEKRISQEKGRLFVNATQGGARIRGTTVMNLAEAADKYLTNKNLNVTKLISELLMKG